MKTTPLTVLAFTAGIATANPVQSTTISEYTVDTAGYPVIGVTFDVSGMQFNDAQGSAINEIFSASLPFSVITGLAWDVHLTSFGISWASDAVMRFENQFDLILSDETYPVTSQNYYSGEYDFTDHGLHNIIVGPDRILNIEFFDTFVDNNGTGEAYFEAGSTLTVYVTFPTPGALALLGLGGLAATRRRR